MRLTQTQVHEMFHYLPYQGVLTKKTKGTSRKPITARYVHVRIDGKVYNVTTATIIWLYMTGEHNPYVKRLDNAKRRKEKLPPVYDNNHWLNFQG
jgi:hypothetical protein